MRLNNLDLVDRNNRPSVDSRVALRVMFINDGEYVDPSEIRDVMVFKRTPSISPSSILDSDGLVAQEYSSYMAAYFAPSAQESGPALYPSSYQYGASGVYRYAQGDYVCVLDGISGVSGSHSLWGTQTVVANTASTTGEYFEVWTVRYPGQSDYKTVFNWFNLYNDTFQTITEPLMIRAHNELSVKKIPIGSKRDLKITSEFTIENKEIDQNIKNLFKTNIAVNPQIEIVKVNEDINLPARVEVSGFSDTSSLIHVTSKNTFVFTWDTEDLLTHPSLLAGTFGSPTGVYYVRVKYKLMNEEIISPRLFLQVI